MAFLLRVVLREEKEVMNDPAVKPPDATTLWPLLRRDLMALDTTQRITLGCHGTGLLNLRR